MYGARYRRIRDIGRWTSDRYSRYHASLTREVDKNVERSQLKINTIDCHADENCKAHHTDEYDFEKAGLILRRGQVFRTSVTFNRPMDKEKDKLILQFTIGSHPQQSKHTIIRVQDTESLSTSSWGMQIAQQTGTTVDLLVMSPADAIVGAYSVYLEIISKKFDGKELVVSRTELHGKLTILFNAWCKEDSVYMENDADRFEYVLNDKGRIWIGSSKSFYGYPWTFGQFAPVALKACFKLMEMAQVPVAGNPIRFCRVISKMVNAQDDNGVLIGNWSGNFEGGESPLSWTGSVRILQQFMDYERSVKYGQCWVFSGVVTTLLRAIGIPTRSVTNFASAHDNDGSMTIDYHFDMNGKPIESLNDSIWNFHVWNESFFTRPDLPGGDDHNTNYDGWQAHDATPQETSDGVFQCGPCPLKAIQRGEVYLPYDTGFVFAEVNGDKVFWQVDRNGEMKVIGLERELIGKFISTKAVGSNARNDITLLYKFPEGTEEERKAVKLANQHSSRKHYDIYSTSTNKDVSFEIKTSDNVMFGDDFDIKLALKNTSGKPRTVKVTIDSQTCYYTGKTAADLKDNIEELTVGGKKERTVVLPITFEDYKNMAPDLSIKVYFKAEVKETGQLYVKMDVVDFKKPELHVQFPEQVHLYQPLKMIFSFNNPLPVALKSGRLNLECTKMIPNTVSQLIRHNVEPHGKAMIPVTVEFSKVGLQYVTAAFTSDRLVGVSELFEVEVVD